MNITLESGDEGRRGSISGEEKEPSALKQSAEESIIAIRISRGPTPIRVEATAVEKHRRVEATVVGPGEEKRRKGRRGRRRTDGWRRW